MGREGLAIEIHVDTVHVDSQQGFMLPVYNTVCCY